MYALDLNFQEELAEDAEAEQEMNKEVPEMDSLDRVIMAAAMVEADAGNTVVETGQVKRSLILKVVFSC